MFLLKKKLDKGSRHYKNAKREHFRKRWSKQAGSWFNLICFFCRTVLRYSSALHTSMRKQMSCPQYLSRPGYVGHLIGTIRLTCLFTNKFPSEKLAAEWSEVS